MIESLQLSDDDIHVWVAPLQNPENFAGMALLNADEQERANRFHSHLHQQRFIAAHAFLRTILSFYLKQSATDLMFEYNQHDKPSVVNNINLQFNLSQGYSSNSCFSMAI